VSFLPSRLPTLYHPASGLLILAVDWLLFSGGVLTLGVSTPILLVVGGGLSALAVTALQMRYGEETRGRALMKGALGGLAVGLPFPVAGTGLGGAVLALSGLNRLRRPSHEESDE
jgi:hypothetical protein